MLFELQNASGTFQITRDVFLLSVRWKYALVYSVNIVAFLGTPQDYIRYVRKVVTLLRDAEVTIKLKMCKFFTKIVDYLGQVIRPRRLKVSSHKMDSIRRHKAPTNLTKFTSLLRLCSVFSQFVPIFVRLAAQLRQRLKKDKPAIFETLNETELSSMNSLKKSLIPLPVQGLPDNSEHITLDSHACNAQTSCVPLQQQPDKSAKSVG